MCRQAQDRIKFGKRPTVYSINDGQACADHDRSVGEGVGPQEYTLIKLEVIKPYPAHLAALHGYEHVYLVAATLRPETMYGQTNCFLLPEGEYGAFEMKDGTVFVCSERSMLNMSYQVRRNDLCVCPSFVSSTAWVWDDGCVLVVFGRAVLDA